MTDDATLIRPATAGDCAPLARTLAPLPLFTAYDLDAARLQTRLELALTQIGHTVLVAVVAAAPVGVCWFLSQGTFGTGAYLRLLALAPETQGSGLGARLLAAYESAATPRGGWFLLTSDFNAGAQRFYARHGYRLVGELPGFAKAGITERIMWKPAAPA